MEIKQFIAGRAFIVNKGKILIIREAKGYAGGSQIGKYDFPGGKVKPGENFKEALIRETREECGLTISVNKPFYVAEWWPKVQDKNIQIVGIFFECDVIGDGTVTLGKDFDDYKWITINDFDKYELIKENREACEAYVSM